MARQLWPVIALAFALAALGGTLALRSISAGVEARSKPHVVAAPRPTVSPPRHVVRHPPARAPGPAPAFVAHVKGAVAVRARPGGTVDLVVRNRTEFGSPRTLGVVRRRGRWLGVTLPELGNGRLGWVDSRGAGVDTGRTPVRLEVDLSARRLVLRRGARVVRTVRVSIGRPGSPTPTGRFAVTDKLPGARYSASYGCCILALSGRQPHLPAGWTGGDRLAIHGAPAGEPIGVASSAGCLHAGERDLRQLMRVVPLGAPVVIRA
jgi:lipoprotein-anchoring transpeptidase ErfK/SrfK